MSAPQLLTLGGLAYEPPAIAASALEARDALVAEAAEITLIDDALAAGAAVNVLKDITTRLRECEDARKAIKGPIDELVGQIQDVAKTYASPLKAEEARLSRLLGAYQQAERDKAAKAERDAREAARRAQEEERRKIEAAAREHGEDSVEVQQAAEAAAETVAAARQEVANVAPPKLAGTAVKKTWRFEVEDIALLHKSHPELVVLTPNKAAINAILKHTQSIPGLRVFEDIQTIIR